MSAESKDERIFSMIVTKNGTVGFITELPSVKTTTSITGPNGLEGNEEISRHALDVDHAGYIELMNKNITHHIGYDPATRKAIIKGPKKQAGTN